MEADRARVCVIGSINMDLVARAPRLPRPGESVLGATFETHPGGKGANQAVAAARMGAAVSLIGAVGDDDYGRRLREVVGAEGVEVSRVAMRAAVATGVGVITLGEDGENAIVVASGANMTVSPADIDAARGAIAEADILLLQLEIPLESVRRAVEVALEVGTPVMLNAAPHPPGVKLSAELLAGVDVLVVNRVEAEMVSAGRMAGGHFAYSRVSRMEVEELKPAALPEDNEALCEVIERLTALGIETVLVTLGGEGAAMIRKQQRCASMFESYPVEAVDTVGAGDAFCGAFAVRIAENQIGGGGEEGIYDAVHWGMAAGALAVTKSGAIPSMPRRADVREMLKSF